MKMDYAIISEQSKKLKKVSSDIKDILSKVKSCGSSVMSQGMWTGDASIFFNTYMNNLSSYYDQVSSVLSSSADYLDVCVYNYKKLEENIVNNVFGAGEVTPSGSAPANINVLKQGK